MVATRLAFVPLFFAIVISGAYAFPLESKEPAILVELTQFEPESVTSADQLGTLAAGKINVTGRFVTYDYYGEQKPIRYAPVFIYDYNDYSLNELLGQVTTDDNGAFAAGPFDNDDSESGTADVMVMLWSLWDRIEVRTDNVGLPYSGYSNVSRDVPDGIVDKGSIGPTGNVSGVWSAYDALAEAWHFLNSSLNYSAPLVKLRWPDMTWLIFTVPYGAHYDSGGDIFIGEDAATSPDVITHEYSHFLMYNLYGSWLPDSPNCTDHTFYGRSSAGCAWTEGWAEFLPLVVHGNSTFQYFGHYSADLEPVEAGESGDDVEGRVAASLYDIYDDSSDGFDSLSSGIHGIWGIVNNTRSNNLSEFWSSWSSSGKNRSAGLGALFQNTIDYCIDSDADGFREWPCGTDCNDTNFDIKPNTAESCNGIDDNCNGVVDEGFDSDGDGFASCSECNDNNPNVNPNATESCNGIDDNCNGAADEVCERATCGAEINGHIFMTEDLDCYLFNKWWNLVYLPGVSINASNVVFDCNGHSINGEAGSPYNGILIRENVTNVTVRNCSINDFENNVNIQGSGNTIDKATFFSGGFDNNIYITGQNNTLKNVTTNGGGGFFILGNGTSLLGCSLRGRSGFILFSSNNTISNSIITRHESWPVDGTIEIDGNFNVISNTTFGDSGPVRLIGCGNTLNSTTSANNYGYALSAGSYSECMNTVANSALTGTGIDVVLGAGSLTLIDTLYIKEISEGSLTRQWSFPVLVRNGSGDAIAGANVTMRNATNKMFGSKLTIYDGTTSFFVTEYTNMSGHTSWFNPYNITVIKPEFRMFSTVMNATRYKSLTVTLGDGIGGDLNGDCIVDITDLQIVGDAYGSVPGDSSWNPAADMNGDNKIDVLDLSAVGLRYGATC